MGLFDKMKEPVFLKETSEAAKILEKLEGLEKESDEKVRQKIERDKKLIEWGMAGEQNIDFELKNSHMPMYVIHDLYLEYGGLKAQIDYLIVTRKAVFIVECKNLIGDIIINDKGDFIRSMYLSGKNIKEGIYSPVTQNKRHLELIKQMRINEKKNPLLQALIERNFQERYRSMIVLANPKTILKDSYAPKEIRKQVIRVDQLIEQMRKVNQTIEASWSDKEMKAIGEYFLNKHTENPMDYSEKYQVTARSSELGSESMPKEEIQKEIAVCQEMPVVLDEQLIQKLKAYRLAQSQKEQVKPYCIFTNKEMMAIIEQQPHSIEALMKISGFGEVKCRKYGQDILNLLG